MKPLDGRITPGGPDSNPGATHFAALLAATETFRQQIQKGRDLHTLADGQGLDFDYFDRRLDEFVTFVKKARPEDAERVEELHQEILLEFQAEASRVMTGINESTVRFMDKVTHRHEQVKFTMTSEQRDKIEAEVIDPYKDNVREQMLDSMPIEMRKKLEEEKKRFEKEDDFQG